MNLSTNSSYPSPASRPADERPVLVQSSAAPSQFTAPQSLRGRSSHSFASASMSHAPNAPLSLMTISRSFEAGRPSGSTMHGTSRSPSSFAAARRIFPPSTTNAPPRGTTTHPRASNSSGVSLMLAFRRSSSARVHCRGLPGTPSSCPAFVSSLETGTRLNSTPMPHLLSSRPGLAVRPCFLREVQPPEVGEQVAHATPAARVQLVTRTVRRLPHPQGGLHRRTARPAHPAGARRAPQAFRQRGENFQLGRCQISCYHDYFFTEIERGERMEINILRRIT